MKINKIYRGQILRVAVGVTLFAILSLGNTDAQITVSSCTNISSPGEYVLNQSIQSSDSLSCVNINSSDVIFDGAGFTIGGMDNFGTIGINATNSSTALTNVTVKNLNVVKWGAGIGYKGVSNGYITNNTFLNTYGAVILLGNSSNNTLSDNDALENYFGILLGDSSNNNTLSGNNALNNYYGILLDNSSNNTLSGNNASINYGGILLLDSSNNNTLSGNNALNNYYGISLDNSSINNMLSGNNASNNFLGNSSNIQSTTTQPTMTATPTPTAAPATAPTTAPTVAISPEITLPVSASIVTVLPAPESYQYWKGIDDQCSTDRAFANANFGLCEQAQMNLRLLDEEALNHHPVPEIAPSICPSGSVPIPTVPGWCYTPFRL